MSSLPPLDWAIRATLLLAVAVLFARLLERCSATAAHRLLVTVLLCVLLLPFGTSYIPSWQWTPPAWTVADVPGLNSDADENTNTTATVAETITNEGRELSPFAAVNVRPDSPSFDGDELAAAGTGALRTQDHAGPGPQLVVPSAVPVDVARPASATSGAHWPPILAIAWLAVAAVLLVQFGCLINRLRRCVSGCTNASPRLIEQVRQLSLDCGVHRRWQVLLSKPDSMPLACWFGRWFIVVPENLESWPDDVREVALLHELGHVARRDVWADYLAQVVRCILWPNPLAWVAAQDTHRLRERACDEWSLQRYRGDARQYAVCLIAAVDRCRQPRERLACAMADRRDLESRLQRLFSGSSSKLWNRITVPTMLTALGFSVVVATAAPTGALPPDKTPAAASELLPVEVSSEPAPADPALTVAGVVKDEAGQPLAGAAVVLRAKLQPTGYAPGVTHDRDILARTKSDAEGRFRFAGIGIPPRMVDILNKLRHGQAGVQVLAWADGCGLAWQPVNSFAASDLELRLQPQADVSGVVVDEDGNPLAAGNLRATGFTRETQDLDAFLDGEDDLNAVRSEVRFQAAIRDGQFSLAHMPRDYRISVWCESPSGHRSYFLIDTGRGNSTEATYRNAGRDSVPVYCTPIRATAKQRPSVQLIIVDQQGQPVRGGAIEAVTSERHYGGSAAVAEDGTATLIVNQPGVHEVYYAGDPLAPVVGIVQQVNIPPDSTGAIELRLPATRTLIGRVVDVDTGEPVPGVYVSAGTESKDDAFPRATGAMAVSGSDGQFRISVTEGVQTFSLRHDVDGFFVPTSYNVRDSSAPTELPKITVTSDNVLTGIVIRIAHGLLVSGTVLDRNGRPAGGLTVTANSEGGNYRQTSTVTDSEGRYRLSGLSPYFPTSIVVRSEGGVAAQTLAAALGHPWDTTLTRSVNLQLAAGTAVAGRVTQGGHPAAGVNVRLLRAPPKTPGQDGVRFALWGETKTDKDGRYRLVGLRKGDEYQLEVEPRGSAEVRDWQYQMPYSQTVDVEDGATLDVPDAKLQSNGQSLAGIVVDPDGRPVAGISVSARLASGEHLSRPQNGPPPWTETDKEGRFQLTHLPDEPIALMAYKANPAGGRILYPGHAHPAMNAADVRIVFDPSLLEPPEDLD